MHRALGAGLFESVYETVLAHELAAHGLTVERQVAIPIRYKGYTFDEAFRADLVVAGKVIVELKSVDCVTPAHKKQLITYMRLHGCKLGYLLNYGAATMKEGITRCVNRLDEPVDLH